MSEILSNNLGFKTFKLEGQKFRSNNSINLGQNITENLDYIKYLPHILIPVGIILFIGTFGSYCCYEEENPKEEDEDKYQNDSFEKINDGFPLNDTNDSLFSNKDSSLFNKLSCIL
jgi:hypothetical protein